MPLVSFQGNIPQAISVVHLLADKNTQSLVLKSPIYDVHASFQVSFIMMPQSACHFNPFKTHCRF